ncbi:glycoside hydrolase family 15 protein [Gaiella sp.]|jgi:GH15 family glucan-1,4-alpha-glucosidase|uniref:glycoside hydrolase family 15 protein n=1 Tax=Gaiella sp. TaxID=2663207 RepID=UPI002E3295A1|nr:glycoside hydrolase family 15 protein [Gaiella sp.]HEX5585491.1 glycoside hydrolase family 15 protein [Gaiella sp.]
MSRRHGAAAADRRQDTRPANENERPGLHVLREYALLADGERGCLVGPSGGIAWMCFPGWSSDAVFASLLGANGTYMVRPADPFVWGGWYEQGTLIWRGRFVAENGAIVECRDALALPASGNRAVVLRRLLGLSGSAAMDVMLEPRWRFGRDPLRGLGRGDDGGWRGRTGPVHVAWFGAEDARVEDGGGRTILRHQLEVAEGEEHDLVLVLSDEKEETAPDPNVYWSSTESAWRERVPVLGLEMAELDARHAWAVLSGLTSSGGGMVAAATMGLPERANEGRSFDYRYVWIRDQSYAARATVRAGELGLLDGAVRFTRDRLLDDREHLAPAYTTSGDPVPEERRLDLPGYPGGANVAGNHVRGQFQLDVFGEALLLFAEAAAHERVETETWRAVEIAAGAIERRWREPDAGIWELSPDEWAVSRLVCAAGLRAVGAVGPNGEQTARWLALADAIVADTASRSVHASGRWQRSPSDDRVDAALLLPALRGAVPPDDPRSVATLEAVVSELAEDGYVYRYRIDARPLGAAEGAFLLCGFLVSLAFLQRGDLTASARWFERTRAACGPPGLLSEEYDIQQRQLRGNLPQAFVHAELLECALAQASGRL